jgi:hypothetical protein
MATVSFVRSDCRLAIFEVVNRAERTQSQRLPYCRSSRYGQRTGGIVAYLRFQRSIEWTPMTCRWPDT